MVGGLHFLNSRMRERVNLIGKINVGLVEIVKSRANEYNLIYAT